VPLPSLDSECLHSWHCGLGGRPRRPSSLRVPVQPQGVAGQTRSQRSAARICPPRDWHSQPGCGGAEPAHETSRRCFSGSQARPSGCLSPSGRNPVSTLHLFPESPWRSSIVGSRDACTQPSRRYRRTAPPFRFRCRRCAITCWAVLGGQRRAELGSVPAPRAEPPLRAHSLAICEEGHRAALPRAEHTPPRRKYLAPLHLYVRLGGRLPQRGRDLWP